MHNRGSFPKRHTLDRLPRRHQVRARRPESLGQAPRPLLDHRTPDKVGTDLIDELVADLKTKLEPAGVERVLYVLSGFYRWAIRRKVVAHNPVRDYLADLERTERNAIRTTHDPRDTPFIKDRADVVKLFAELQEELPAAAIAYALSALAGLRPGEAVGLEWGDLDLDAGRAMVRRRVRHGEVHTPKSGKPREVPLVPSLVAVLRAWRAKVPADEPLVVPSQRKTGKKAKKVKHLGRRPSPTRWRRPSRRRSCQR